MSERIRGALRKMRCTNRRQLYFYCTLQFCITIRYISCRTCNKAWRQQLQQDACPSYAVMAFPVTSMPIILTSIGCSITGRSQLVCWQRRNISVELKSSRQALLRPPTASTKSWYYMKLAGWVTSCCSLAQSSFGESGDRCPVSQAGIKVGWRRL